MRRALSTSLMVALALALVAGAAAPPPPAKKAAAAPARAADRLDYLFFASDRPVRIRLHARVGEKPYDAAWADFMDALFAWFDKDKNGILSPVEVGRVPNVQGLQAQIQGSIGGNFGTVPFLAMDANKDDKVSREEFRVYFRASGFSGFNLSNNNSQATQAKQVNEALLKRLDKNGDGKLSADEVAGMFDKLHSLDEDEDEMLTEAELNTRSGGNQAYAVKTAVYGGTRAAPVVETGFVAVAPGKEAAAINQLVARYDRNKDGKLSRAEVGFDKALFAALDHDGDGALSPGELRAFVASEPDLVCRLQLGPPPQSKGLLGRLGLAAVLPPGGPRLEILNRKTLRGNLKKTLRTFNGDTAAFELGDTRMSLQVNGVQGMQFNRNNGSRNFYLNEFTSHAGKKDHVTRSDNKMGRPYLFQIFAQADGDADGKLTRKELVAWFDLLVAGQDCNISLTVHDLGRGLFPVLDASGDGRLSLREMAHAWDQLGPLAGAGKAFSLEKVPRTLRVVVAVGNNTSYRAVPGEVYASRRGPVRPAPRGPVPVWFGKMDRNNDGDLSPKEWLGTEEDFRAIDADGDGLISRDEAASFEGRKKSASARP